MSSSLRSTHYSASSSLANGHHHPASKSYLAGVQDAYWSDDETEDTECPLCLETLDVADLNFKPCPCGYQICPFCWHHIKENLNGRCPACRREYSNDAVESKPLGPEDQKRLNQQKKQRERERKELENLGRRHLVNVRVVQRNLVYVLGLGPRFAKEELIPSLRSTEYFGKYGKISKMLLVKRAPSGSRAQVGLYITYHRREDAARAIAAVDGSPSPSGDGEIMRASYGTTKYCMNFLRGVNCTNHGCVELHEWADDRDCFTKEDLATLKHTMKDTEHLPRNQVKRRDDSESSALPRGASWAQKSTTSPTVSNGLPPGLSSVSRQSRQPSSSRSTRGQTAPSISTPSSSSRVSDSHRTRTLPQSERKPGHSSLGSTSRPSTPGSSSLPPRPAAGSSDVAPSPSMSSPASVHAEPHLTSPPKERPKSKRSTAPPPVESISTKTVPLSSQPASSTTPAPSEPTQAITSPESATQQSLSPPLSALSPQIPTATPPPPPVTQSNAGYQLSNQARALIDDVKSRRESIVHNPMQSPFPDFDRTLSLLGDSQYSFSFNIDPKFAVPPASPSPFMQQPPKEFSGFFDPFSSALPGPSSDPPAPPPGLHVPTAGTRTFQTDVFSTAGLDGRIHAASRGAMAPSPGYSGSFDPFAAGGDERNSPAPRLHAVAAAAAMLDDESLRRGSRFGFGRRTSQNSVPSSGAANPSLLGGLSLGSISGAMHSSSHNAGLSSSSPLYSTTSDLHSPQPQLQWNPQQQQDVGLRSLSRTQMLNVLQTGMRSQEQQRPQLTQAMNEAALKQMLSIGARHPMDQVDLVLEQHRHALNDGHNGNNLLNITQGFNDPSVLSMSQRIAQTNLNARDGNFHQQSDIPPGMGGILSRQMMNSQPSSLQQNHLGPPPGMQQPSLEQTRYSLAPPMLGGSNNGNATTIGAQFSNAASPNGTHISLSISTSIPASPSAFASSMHTTSNPASASVSVLSSPLLSTSDFPALPSATPDSQSKRDQSHPFIQSTAPKNAQSITRKVPKHTNSTPTTPLTVPQTPVHSAPPPLVPVPPSEKAVAEESPVSSHNAPKSMSKNPPTAAKQPPPPKQPKSVKPPTPLPAVILPATPEVEQVPILSKKSKKAKALKQPKASKEDLTEDKSASATEKAAESSSAPLSPVMKVAQVSEVSHVSIVNEAPAPVASVETTPLASLLEQLIDELDPDAMNFFNLQSITPKSQTPLRYGPLVHALSALSVGGNSLANNIPTSSIDSAVTSFQQLLETLTQTISDLLRFLPRTTWDDNSSFDGVLRDMLKAEDVLEEHGEEGGGKEDEVVALTLALEKRARWMEVQLAKLEELHRDINTAAVRAVLSSNDRGWDPSGFLPKLGDALVKFNQLGKVRVDDGTRTMRKMTVEELEAALSAAKKEEGLAENEVVSAIEGNRARLLGFD